MPTIHTEDGVDLHYEEVGTGTPMVFVHEYAGDVGPGSRSCAFFGRRYRCIAFNARGYPPSAVPADRAPIPGPRHRRYRRRHPGIGLAPAHVVGLSMGAFATLHLGLRYPQMARSLTAAGVGYGAAPDKRAQFHAETDATAAKIEALGMAEMGKSYARGPTRLVFEEKDPRGYAEFHDQLLEHDTKGSVLTMRGVQQGNGRACSSWKPASGR